LEEIRTQVGILNLPRSAAHPDDKVLKVFNKLKQHETKSPADPNLQELQASAMNSYRIGSDVIKTENGFEVCLEVIV